MFIPNANAAAEAAAIKQACARVEQLALELVPDDIRSACQINVSEVQCGDPQCAPIDTTVLILFESGGQGMLGLPMESNEVTDEELAEAFPPEEILRKWFHGQDAEWPPDNSNAMEEGTLPQLRFDVGDKVLCRIGPDAITGWAKGTIVQLWYRESSWPEGSWAPYKVQLDDGRKIFAPGDLDQIIKKQS